MTALEAIKAELGTVEDLIVIVDDPLAQRVVNAWRRFGRRQVDRPLKKNETAEEAAQDLWNKTSATFSLQDLANQADVPSTRCAKIFLRLMRAGIVYPDGTISKSAQDLLFGRAQAYIRGMIPKRKNNGRA